MALLHGVGHLRCFKMPFQVTKFCSVESDGRLIMETDGHVLFQSNIPAFFWRVWEHHAEVSVRLTELQPCTSRKQVRALPLQQLVRWSWWGATWTQRSRTSATGLACRACDH